MKRPAKIKDEDVLAYIDFLEAELRVFTESPLIQAYLSTLNFLNKIDAQIIEREIDIFAEKSKPQFEMAHKFLTEKQAYLEQLEYLRAAMTPEKQKQLRKELELDSLPMPERMALIKSQNGNQRRKNTSI